MDDSTRFRAGLLRARGATGAAAPMALCPAGAGWAAGAEQASARPSAIVQAQE